MLLKLLKSKKGFSLIELMVVVAIIAILSTIAIPSYQNFQAKARQKEGFALLSAYYTAAHATRAEFNFYPGNFVATGFAPTGQLTYRVTAKDNGTNVPYGSDDAACITTAAACACAAPNACPNFKTWQENPAGGVGGPVGPVAATAAVKATDTAFITAASGIISSTADSADEYTMDQLKVLKMIKDGIN